MRNKDIEIILKEFYTVLKEQKKVPNWFSVLCNKKKYQVEVDPVMYDGEVDNFELVVFNQKDAEMYFINLERGYVIECDPKCCSKIKSCDFLLLDNYDLNILSQRLVTMALELYGVDDRKILDF